MPKCSSSCRLSPSKSSHMYLPLRFAARIFLPTRNCSSSACGTLNTSVQKGGQRKQACQQGSGVRCPRGRRCPVPPSGQLRAACCEAAACWRRLRPPTVVVRHHGLGDGLADALALRQAPCCLHLREFRHLSGVGRVGRGERRCGGDEWPSLPGVSLIGLWRGWLGWRGLSPVMGGDGSPQRAMRPRRRWRAQTTLPFAPRDGYIPPPQAGAPSPHCTAQLLTLGTAPDPRRSRCCSECRRASARTVAGSVAAGAVPDAIH
jgi:hypothetical protein